jgi:hypothetical protein
MVENLAGQFGLDRNQAQAALAQLVPALGKGVSNNIAQPGGLGGLIGALTSGKHARYLEEPAQLAQADTVNDGNAILGHLFGSKEVSRQVARSGAAKSGLSDDVLKKMLPVVATLVMGALSKQREEPGGGLAAMLGGGESSGSTNMLTAFLDADGDGSIADDVLGMLFKR